MRNCDSANHPHIHFCWLSSMIYWYSVRQVLGIYDVVSGYYTVNGLNLDIGSPWYHFECLCMRHRSHWYWGGGALKDFVCFAQKQYHPSPIVIVLSMPTKKSFMPFQIFPFLLLFLNRKKLFNWYTSIFSQCALYTLMV